jgi:hypothetical protein
MSEVSERHEVRVRGRGQTIVFIADSSDGRLVIRQEPDAGDAADVCSLTLRDPDELRAFFTGLRRIVSSLGYGGETAPAARPRPLPPRRRGGPRRRRGGGGRHPAHPGGGPRRGPRGPHQPGAPAHPQAFAPWTPQEEEEIRREHEAGEPIEAIARRHKRSPRAIELRLQRLGVL